MLNILLALDCSPHSRRAAEYVVRLVPHLSGTRVVLLTVATGIPSHGHVPAPQEDEPELHGDEDYHQEQKEISGFLREIRKKLLDAGVQAGQIDVRVKPMTRGVAQDILDEAADAGCETLVVGRRAGSLVKTLFHGSVSSDLLRHASGRTIWIVE